MLSGVMKSGSPALKSTTSMPSRRSLSASAITFIVEETLIADMRSAMAGLLSVGVILLSASVTGSFMVRKASPQPVFHQRWNESRNVTAQRDDFLHQLRTDKGESLAGWQEDSLEPR